MHVYGHVSSQPTAKLSIGVFTWRNPPPWGLKQHWAGKACKGGGAGLWLRPKLAVPRNQASASWLGVWYLDQCQSLGS